MEDGITCSLLSAFAYGKPPEFPLLWRKCHSELSHIDRFSCNDSDAQVLLCFRESDSTVFVAFRGTDSIRDVLHDAWVIKNEAPFLSDNCPDSKVHKGFLQQFDSCKDICMKYLNKSKHSRVVVTGHSLGGAIATIFAIFLKDSGFSNVDCWTFGSPRVGNRAFANHVDKNIRINRVVVNHDPVTDVPLRIRWKHAGNKIWIINGNTIQLDGKDGILNLVRPPNLLCVGDHEMKKYIESMLISHDNGMEVFWNGTFLFLLLIFVLYQWRTSSSVEQSH